MEVSAQLSEEPSHIWAGGRGKKKVQGQKSLSEWNSLKAFPFAKSIFLSPFLTLKWKNVNKQTLNRKF